MHAGRGFIIDQQEAIHEFTTQGMDDLAAALTVNIDEHVLGGALPQVAQTGDTEQGSSMMRPGSMNGEAPLDVKRDLRPVHCHIHWWKLAMQSHFSLR